MLTNIYKTFPLGSLILVVILISKSHGNFQNEYDSDIANPYNIYDCSSLSTEEAQGYQAKTYVQLSAQSLGHGKVSFKEDGIYGTAV